MATTARSAANAAGGSANPRTKVSQKVEKTVRRRRHSEVRPSFFLFAASVAFPITGRSSWPTHSGSSTLRQSFEKTATNAIVDSRPNR